MSIDLQVVIEHRLDEDDIATLPARLDEDADVVAAAAYLVGVARTRGLVTPMREACFFAPATRVDWLGRSRPLSWPRARLGHWAGFQIRPGARAFQLVYLDRVDALARNERLAQVVRRACHAFARSVGGAMAVYLPDSTHPICGMGGLAGQGRSIEEIVTELRRQFGDPSTSFAEVATGGWWPDELADLTR